jgi:uncharacterized membrane protein YdfJ with MMPL/SSD domain
VSLPTSHGEGLAGAVGRFILPALDTGQNSTRMLASRTVVIPVQAAVMNLLSIGAACGVLTAIFQWG